MSSVSRKKTVCLFPAKTSLQIYDLNILTLYNKNICTVCVRVIRNLNIVPNLFDFPCCVEYSFYYNNNFCANLCKGIHDKEKIYGSKNTACLHESC